MSPEQLRDIIFTINTRRLGRLAEIIIKRLYQFDKPRSRHHDLWNTATGQRIEVKFSTVQQELEKINEDKLLEILSREITSDRRVAFGQWTTNKFACNIQQIKRTEFDQLYYGMFFDDVIKIFTVLPADIDSSIGYGNKQHKGNVGEGQFHITHQTLQTHLDRFLIKTLTYQELLDLLS